MLLIKLLLHLIIPLLFFYFFLFLDLIFIILVLGSLIERDFLSFLWEIAILLLFMFFASKSYRPLVKTYKEITKNHFLDTYVFPKELYEILSEKYPYLKKSEVEEVVEAMKEFYRFQINKDLSIPRYMPSRVVDFACQIYFDMPNSSLFSKKFKNYHRILPKGNSSSSKELITVLLAGQYEKSINSKISEMWCYCCKKEYIDPFFPLSFPSLFTIDKRLKIPSGFIYLLLILMIGGLNL